MTNADDEYTEQVLATGAWIDNPFLEELLTRSEGSDVTVDDINITAAVGAGDNYLSILYKTTVKYTVNDTAEEKVKHLMIKGVPTVKFLLDMVEGMGVFKKEISLYNDCLPAMHRALKQYFPPGTEYVGPDSYRCARENTLVMEDLGEDDYKMASRIDQLDFEHCEMTLRTLARFHALSVKVYQENPEYVLECGVELYIEENREMLQQYLEAAFPLLGSAVESWGENAKYSEALCTVGDHFYDKLIYTMRPKENFNVLNHGDMWVNNMMYKYDEDGSLSSCKLVDFQLLRYSSPALDLHYFFFTSVKPDVLINQMDDLLEIYHEALTSDMATLELDIDYPLEELREDFRDRAAFGLLALVQILPIVVAPPAKPLDLDDYDPEDVKPEDEHPLMTNFKNPGFQEIAGRFLEHMDKIGFLHEAQERTNHISEKIKAALEEGGEEGDEEGQGQKKNRAPTARVTSAHDRKVLARLRSTVWRLISQPICE